LHLLTKNILARQLSLSDQSVGDSFSPRAPNNQYVLYYSNSCQMVPPAQDRQ